MPDELVRAKGYAFKLLSRRSYSVEEFRQRLQRKGFSTATIGQIITAMADYGYLDDETYARNFMELLLTRRGYGTRRILQELLARGIDRELAGQLLDEISADEELERALSIAKKKIRYLPRDHRLKTYRRLASFLTRKGFSAEISRRVLEVVLPLGNRDSAD